MNDLSSATMILNDIRNWIRASSFASVKSLLQEALPDEKSRQVYQMSDGTKAVDDIRKTLKMSPNKVTALQQKCQSMGLMELRDDKKRIRLFDLSDFDMIEESE